MSSPEALHRWSSGLTGYITTGTETRKNQINDDEWFVARSRRPAEGFESATSSGISLRTDLTQL
jgi:hypothetical protein